MFITLEGIEGSGKTTQMKAIEQFLLDNGHKVVMTREPGATETGQKIRSILLDPENSAISPLCELLLYGANRAQHMAEVILPALKTGKTVLCDRFADATTAYQGAARGLDMVLIDHIYSIVAGHLNPDLTMLPGYDGNIAFVLKPDLTILFDINPSEGLERTFKALKKGQRVENESRFEQEELAFHERVRQGYLAIAAKEKERFLIVDASLSREKVLQNITSELKKHKITSQEDRK